MSSDITLPAFELDCRDWLVITPGESGLPEEVGGAPLVAVLSTAVLGEQFLSVSGVLTLGLLDDEPVVPSADEAGPTALVDSDEGSVRYVIPTPDRSLALVAEFCDPPVDAECTRRIEALMASFRWSAA